MVEAGDGTDGRATLGGEQRSSTAVGVDGGAVAATVGFGISGIGEGKVLLGRVGQRDDRELRYLHLLWDPGRAERTASASGASSKLGKMPGSRVRRQQHRMVRSLCPIGKDIYGNNSKNSFCKFVKILYKFSFSAVRRRKTLSNKFITNPLKQSAMQTCST